LHCTPAIHSAPLCINIHLIFRRIPVAFQTFESLGNDLPMISRQNGGSLLLYIQTTEIRKFFDQIKDNVKVVKGLEKTFYSATEFSIEDNNGYLLTFAEDEK
jgi:uncharacterized glyoxalase superfamily protein PhnB